MTVRWGLSILDWQRHAIDDRRHHPTGVYKAECSHTLMMATPLEDEPYGRLCELCSNSQFNQAIKE